MVVQMLQLVLKITLVIFMVGSLSTMGMELALREAIAALRNVRFVVFTLVLSFVLCPGLAYLLSKIIPLEPPYAVGLLLLGMAPSAPFMPIMVRKAGGDVGYTAAFMLLAALGTVVFMPIAAPLMITGLSASAWTIGRPLVFFVLAPLVLGAAIKGVSANGASRLCPLVQRVTNVSAIVMLGDMVIIYRERFLLSIGSFATATLVMFGVSATVATFNLSVGLNDGEKAVLCIGICTRNVGAAFAPLLAVKVDPRSTTMVALAVPVTLVLSYLTARWFRSRIKAVQAVASRH
jgi:bile acid:Na+ symporter, BASS family